MPTMIKSKTIIKSHETQAHNLVHFLPAAYNLPWLVRQDRVRNVIAVIQ